MIKSVKVGAVFVALASMALAACGGGSGGAAASGSASGGGGGGGKELIISTDLPLQGASKDASDSTNDLIQVYLDSIGGKVGNFTVKLKKYDDSTAAKGAWDDAKCEANANEHIQTANEIAVMGTYNSGCAKIITPILNKDESGPMLMVSHANTNPGLTMAWDPGEPQKFYPTGKRNYARVITTDDKQGSAAAKYAATKLGVKKVYILNDNQTYGQGVAKAFADAAPGAGIQVLGNEAWDKNQKSYAALFDKIKALQPDMVYLSGIYDNNGGQLIKDKVQVLGDNTKVKLMAPDGMVGYTELQKLPQGEGLYLTFGGKSTDQLKAGGGNAAKLLDAYAKAHGGKDPTTSYALYAVAAVQVIIEAIKKSDGTRKGVTDAVFNGGGITVPADISAIGTEVKIDPKTGDAVGGLISYLQLTGGKETFLEAQAS